MGGGVRSRGLRLLGLDEGLGWWRGLVLLDEGWRWWSGLSSLWVGEDEMGSGEGTGFGMAVGEGSFLPPCTHRGAAGLDAPDDSGVAVGMCATTSLVVQQTANLLLNPQTHIHRVLRTELAGTGRRVGFLGRRHDREGFLSNFNNGKGKERKAYGYDTRGVSLRLFSSLHFISFPFLSFFLPS